MRRLSNLLLHDGTRRPLVLHNTAIHQRFALWPPFIGAQQRHCGTADIQLDKSYIDPFAFLFFIIIKYTNLSLRTTKDVSCYIVLEMNVRLGI